MLRSNMCENAQVGFDVNSDWWNIATRRFQNQIEFSKSIEFFLKITIKGAAKTVNLQFLTPSEVKRLQHKPFWMPVVFVVGLFFRFSLAKPAVTSRIVFDSEPEVQAENVPNL